VWRKEGEEGRKTGGRGGKKETRWSGEQEKEGGPELAEKSERDLGSFRAILPQPF